MLFPSEVVGSPLLLVRRRLFTSLGAAASSAVLLRMLRPPIVADGKASVTTFGIGSWPAAVLLQVSAENRVKLSSAFPVCECASSADTAAWIWEVPVALASSASCVHDGISASFVTTHFPNKDSRGLRFVESRGSNVHGRMYKQ